MPLKLRQKDEERLTEYILGEIEQSQSDQSEFLQNLKLWTNLYEGKVYEKDFPWKDCANIRLPFTATNCEAIFSRMMNSIFSMEPFWTVKPLAAGTWDYAKNLETFLEFASGSVLRMYETCQSWFMPAVKYGTSPLKISWREDWRSYFKRIGGERVLDKRLMFRGPRLEPLPLQDFFRPSGYANIKDFPWVGHRFYLNTMQIKGMKADYGWNEKYIDKVLSFPVERKTEVEDEVAEKTGVQNILCDQYEFYECYLYWNMKEDDDVYVPLMAVIHPTTRQLLYVEDFPYDHGEWPFAAIRYMPRENDFLGIGVIQMLEHIQKTLDTSMNQIIDNATLANARWFKWKKGSPLPRNLKIRPGAVIPVDDPNDIVAEQLGDTYQSNPFYIQFLMQQGERRSGLTEYSMGRESPVVGSRATATSTLALIQEANRRFDLTLKDIRNSSTEVGYQCLELWQQYTDGLYDYMYKRPEVANAMFAALPNTQQELMQKSIEFSGTDFRSSYMIELKASSSASNKEIEKQNNMALYQMMAQHNQQMAQIVMQLESPQAPPGFKDFMYKIGVAQGELARRILYSYDIKDAETLAVSLGEYNAQLSAMAQQIAAATMPQQGMGGMAGNPEEAGGGPNPGVPQQMAPGPNGGGVAQMQAGPGGHPAGY